MKFDDRYNIPLLNERERELLEETRNLKTWNDVLILTRKVWDYSKEENKLKFDIIKMRGAGQQQDQKDLDLTKDMIKSET